MSFVRVRGSCSCCSCKIWVFVFVFVHEQNFSNCSCSCSCQKFLFVQLIFPFWLLNIEAVYFCELALHNNAKNMDFYFDRKTYRKYKNMHFLYASCLCVKSHPFFAPSSKCLFIFSVFVCLTIVIMSIYDDFFNVDGHLTKPTAQNYKVQDEVEFIDQDDDFARILNENVDFPPVLSDVKVKVETVRSLYFFNCLFF